MEEIREKLKGLAVIVPCLNPDEKLMQVVRGMLAQGFSHILVEGCPLASPMGNN